MQHFIVLSEQRVGSHMLLSLLNSHPQVHCNSDLMTADVIERGEEWAYQQGFALPPIYPDRVHFPPGKSPSALGFLLKIKSNLHRTVARRRGLKIVFLERRNRLAVLLSRKVSETLGCYDTPHLGVSIDQARERRELHPPVRISVEDALTFFAEWEATRAEVMQCLQQSDCIHVTYEELMRERRETMNRIFAHLGVESFEAFPTGKWGSEKLDPRPLETAIVNYRELIDALTARGFHRWLPAEADRC